MEFQKSPYYDLYKSRILNMFDNVSHERLGHCSFFVAGVAWPFQDPLPDGKPAECDPTGRLFVAGQRVRRCCLAHCLVRSIVRFEEIMPVALHWAGVATPNSIAAAKALELLPVICPTQTT